MPPRFEGKFGIPGSHEVDSQLTSSLYRLPETVTPEQVDQAMEKITRLLVERELNLSLSQKQTLHLKIARHFEKHSDFPVTSCVDALVESPRFLDSDKGSIEKLLDLHHVKTLQKIAERRKRTAMKEGDEGYNPYENLFETQSGNYYMARLLNRAHLEKESDELSHCVGNSDHYINKIINGDIEIFSFRRKTDDVALFTIEYDKKRGDFLQVRGYGDASPILDHEGTELLEALEAIATTVDDEGKKRVIKSQALVDIKLVSTLIKKQENRELFTRDELRRLYEVDQSLVGFNDNERDSRIEELLLHRDRKEDIQSLCNCQPEYIATDFININEHTQVFCEDTGKKITFFDFRLEENKQKLPQLLELAQTIKATGSPARPDMSFEGGIIKLDIDTQIQESLKTWNDAKVAYKNADNKSPSWIWHELDAIPYSAPQSLSLDVIVLNHGATTPQQRDKFVEDMDRAGYRPLEFSELVALGIIKPEFNKRNEILNTYKKYSLGGVLLAPSLYWSGDERWLDAVRCGDEWVDRDRFVFVRK